MPIEAERETDKEPVRTVNGGTSKNRKGRPRTRPPEAAEGQRWVACMICGAEVLRQPHANGKYICSSKCWGEVQRRSSRRRFPRPVSNEWLREHYVDKGLDCTKIAKMLSIDPKTAWQWIRDAGIETRKRGDACTHKWTKGTPSAFAGKKHTEATKELTRQARLKDGRIPAYINGVHWMKALGRRSGAWKGGITPERQAFYATPEWSDAVKAVWARDDARCRKCGLDNRDVVRGTVQFHIHHIDSFMIRERRAVVDNLVLLCQYCHRWVHGIKNADKEFIGHGH